MTKHFYRIFIFLLIVSMKLGNIDTGRNNDNVTSELDYMPSVVVSSSLNNNMIIAKYEHRNYTNDSMDDVYLLTNDAIYDILISVVRENDDFDYIEAGGMLYVPKLSKGEAINLSVLVESSELRIAYTNSAGKYEAVLMNWDEVESAFLLSPIKPNLVNEYYDSIYFDGEDYAHFSMYTKEFHNKVLASDFEAYVPKGFVISGGSLGDINSDGIEDAVLCMITAGYRVASYSGIMPLILLLGQPDGGYEVERSNPGALFTPYRSSSYPVAGTGYIDIVYYYIGGAALNNTEVYRFYYDSEKRDWLLKKFLRQPTFNTDYSEKMPYNFVQALPSFYDMPLIEFERDVFWNESYELDYFDVIVQGWFPDSWHSDQRYLYTLALRVNESEGYYEGYIHKYYESLDSGNYVQTIRGDIEIGTLPIIAVNEEESVFIIQNEKWKLHEENGGAFYLVP